MFSRSGAVVILNVVSRLFFSSSVSQPPVTKLSHILGLTGFFLPLPGGSAGPGLPPVPLYCVAPI